MSVVHTPPGGSATAPSGYAALSREIQAAGLLQRRPRFYGAMLTVNLLLLAGVVAAMVLLRDSWWELAVAPFFAVVSVQIAFFGHDIGHRQFTRRARACLLLGLVHANLLNGMSYAWWIDKHNAHHAHPNDLTTDPDVRAGVLVFDTSQAATRHGIASWVTRRQAWLFFPMLLLEALNLQAASVHALATGGLKHRGAELTLIGVHIAAYATLLGTMMTWPQIVAFVAVHQGLRGLYLGSSFAPNHKGMPVLSAEEAADPFLRQVLTSRNVRGGRFTDVALGGLNYQIEHHLFPSMPRANLPSAQVIVRDFCQRRGVPYVETSAWGSWVLVIAHLNRVGAAPRRPGVMRA